MRRLLPLLVVSGLVLAACGGGSAVATVGDVDITRSQVDAMRPGRMAASQLVTEDLNRLITTEVLRQGLVDLGLEVPEADLETATADLVASIEAQGTSWDDFKAEQEVTDELVDIAIFQQVAQEVAIAHFVELAEVSDDDVRAEFDRTIDSRSEVCAAHILLAFPEGADDAAKQAVADAAANLHDLVIAPDADFAALATEHSEDPGSGANGGDLGCSAPDRYVPEFSAAAMAAELGVPTEPVESSFGYHIILVNDRTIPTFEESAETVRAELVDSTAITEVNAWYLDVVKAATVTVDPAFGTWETDANGIPGLRAPAA